MAKYLPSIGPYPTQRDGFARSMGESAYPTLWRGLVGYWAPFVDQRVVYGASTGYLLDFSGRQNHMIGQGWGYDSYRHGIDNQPFHMVYITVNDWCKGPDTLELQRGFSICTYGVIDLITSGQRATIYARRDATNYAFHFRVNQSNQKLSALWTSGSVDSSLGPTLGQWHMMGVTTTRTGGTIFYLDDQKDDKGGARTLTRTNGSFISIGSHSGGTSDLWDGAFAFVGIWDRELSDHEFMLMYKGASPLHRKRTAIGKVPVVGGTTVPIFDHHYRMLRSA